jgi:formate-dependent nitrite reductase membrane component NrfD
MIQTRSYEFMVKYTPQREWIEKRGIFMWLAMFSIELGAGAFVVSSIVGNTLGMLIGWLLCALLGGGFHLYYLGKPFRFWRMVFSSGWRSSWISRGLIFVSLFLGLGLIHMALTQWLSSPTALMIVADIFAVLTVIYVGFVMASVNGIALWNTPLLPVLYLILGIWGGLGITLVVLNIAGGTGNSSLIEEWSRIFLIAFAFIVLVYLLTIRYQGSAGRASVQAIVTGRIAPFFWAGVVLLGTVVPAGVALATWLGNWSVPTVFLVILIIFELLGDLSLRYSLLKAGMYAPLLPSIK